MQLDARSERALRSVHPDLVRVVRRAATLTAIPFIVTEGLRTLERQKHLVAIGASQTLNSRHLTGHAADLAPLVDGKPAWDWPLVFKIAEAMRQATRAEKVELRWGGAWDRRLNTINGTPERESASYVERRRAARRKAFLDGPHYELPADLYPTAR